MWRTRQPDPRDREPRQSSFSISSRNRTSARRGSTRFADRRGIMRIRPVLITVAATVLALFPLALHGGPLWEALCYAQIGGLSLATLVTLFIVPVIHSIFVLDLNVIKWREV